MKDDEYYSRLEDSFQQRNPDLLSHLGIDDEDEALLFPALESLKSSQERYSDYSFVAEGGEKVIESVFDDIAQRVVALAKPKRKKPADLERFLKEARLTAFLEHPNIMPVYDIGAKENLPYFSMKLISGDNLNQKRAQGKLTTKELEELIDAFVRVCDAVAFAHSKGVVHLDIKPSNIQLGQFGEVLLCDWGLSRVLNSTENEPLPEKLDADFIEDLSVCGKMRGTPGYMSPALANGIKGSAADDIYALGASLYFILCGQCPHFSEDTKEIVNKTLSAELKSPSLEFPSYNIPESLEAVIMKAIAQENSYKDVLALRSDVVKYLRGYATDAEDAGFLRTVKFLYKRQKSLCNTLVAAFLIMVSMTALFIVSLKEGKDKEVVARLEAEKSLEMYEGELRFNKYLMEGVDQSLKAIIKEVKKKNLPVDIQELLVKVGRNNINGEAYEAAEQMLTTLAGQTQGESRQDALHDLAFIKIFTHDFTGALKLLRGFSPEELERAEIYRFIDICDEFQNKPKERGVLGLVDLLKLVNLVKKHERPRSWFFSHLFTYYLRKCRDLEETQEFLEIVLNHNIDQPGIGVKLSDESGVRTLSFTGGESLQEIEMPAILQSLRIHFLDLSKTGLQNLSFVHRLELKQINVAYTPINNLTPLKHIENLDVVILEKGKVYKYEKALRKKGVTVLYAE